MEFLKNFFTTFFPEKSGEEFRMKKIQKLVYAIVGFALLFLAVPVGAVDLAGYSGSGSDSGIPPTVFGCKVGSGVVTLTIQNILAVRTAEETPLKGGKLLDNARGGKDSVLEYAADPSAFSEIYVLGLGSNWPSKKAVIGSLDLSKALGHAQIHGKDVSVQVRMTGEYQPVNLVTNGSQGLAWGGVVGIGFQAKNNKGQPLLLLPADCNEGKSEYQEALSAMRQRP